ncbi:glycosyl transferase [Sulfuricella sp. T08]|uniref:glycosyltransferase family 4 protein n=1 Tax=Sulfuricella sp. T08 TaxID=1632857 RepID=UPI0006179668|nr:glycosyltransferase family 1 protein [Sulfuricella sp. T08]GAO37820.1 glycosyl transferase [Sulfuricella sp. T08]
MESILIEQYPASRRSLRLAIVTETYPPEVNGVALTLSRFIEGLRERNHEIQLIRPRQDHVEQAAQDNDFDEVLTGGMPIPRYPDLKMGMPSKRLLIKRWLLRRPDLVHIVTEGPLGWSALQAALKLRIPVCSDFRTNFHTYSQHYGIGWLKKPIVAYLRKFHNRTLLTMVPTEHMRAELSATGFSNLRVVARGVDTQLFNPARRSELLRREWGVTPDTPVVLHVGRLAAEKNPAMLTAAFIAIRQRQPRARLVLVGEGPEAKALRNQLPEAIFTGSRSGEDLATHFASGDLFLFPSLTETFGNVTLEAMASGLPVVAYDYAAAAQHVQHGINGLLASYGSTEDFTTMACNLAAMYSHEPEQFRAMGRNARLATESLDWKCVVRQLETLLLSVV